MRRKTGIGLVLLLMTAAPAYPQTSSAPQKPSGDASVAPAAPGRGASSSSQGQSSASSSKHVSGQTKSFSTRTSLRNWKNYCSEEAEYCVSYPPDWDVVGDVMEGTGVVMAPPQEGKDKSLWDEITVSVTDLPEPEKGKERPSFDDIVSVALNGLPGDNVQTLQRSELTLHDRDAELIKVSYNEKDTNRPWIEEIVFIDDELAIYSIALRATPNDVAALEETFRKIVATWRPSEAGPAAPETPAKPASPKPPVKKAPAAKTPPGD